MNPVKVITAIAQLLIPGIVVLMVMGSGVLQLSYLLGVGFPDTKSMTVPNILARGSTKLHRTMDPI